MNLHFIIDRMIDLATGDDPTGTYSILIGTDPLTSDPWISERTTYRNCVIVRSGAVRSTRILLSPAPGNIAHADLIEYRGEILNGGITRQVLQRHPTDPATEAAPHRSDASSDPQETTQADHHALPGTGPVPATSTSENLHS